MYKTKIGDGTVDHGFKYCNDLFDENIPEEIANIKAHMEETGEAFVDLDFDLNDEETIRKYRDGEKFDNYINKSIDRAIRIRDIKWMKDQKFVFTSGNYHDEIVQGVNGTVCFGTAYFRCIAHKKNSMGLPFIEKLIVPETNMDPGRQEIGLYRFNFYWFGQWNPVWIDDYLRWGVDDNVIVRRIEKGIIGWWYMLFTKALMKFMGQLDRKAFLIMITGGCRYQNISFKNDNLDNVFDSGMSAFDFLYDNQGKFILMMVSRKRTEEELLEDTQAGLVRGDKASPNHAYSLFELKKITLLSGKEEKFLLIGEPHRKVELNRTKFRDGSEGWNDVSEEDKIEMNYYKNHAEFQRDGLFWITWDEAVSGETGFDCIFVMPFQDNPSDERRVVGYFEPDVTSISNQVNFRRARKNPIGQINMQFVLDVQPLNDETRRFVWHDLITEIKVKSIMNVYRLTNDPEAKFTDRSKLEESSVHLEEYQQFWGDSSSGQCSDMIWLDTNAKYLFVINALTPKITPFVFRILGKGLELRQLE